MHNGLSECSSTEVPLNSHSEEGDIVSASDEHDEKWLQSERPLRREILSMRMNCKCNFYPPVTQVSGLCSLLDVWGKKKKKEEEEKKVS